MSNFKVLFIYPNQRAESIIPPSIAIFSQLLKERGIQVGLFDSTHYDLDADDYISVPGVSAKDDSKGIVHNLMVRPYESRVDKLEKHVSAVEGLHRKVEDFSPDLIAVTVTESTFLLAVSLLKSIEQFDIPNVIGGVFPTFAPQRAIGFPEVSMICVGEGENAIVDLCEKMRHGQDYSKVTNLWVKRKDGSIVKNGITRPVNVDEIPRPDFELFDEERMFRPMYGTMFKMLPIETHRGCPYQCTFCNSPAQNDLYGSMTNSAFFRKRDLDLVRDELLYVKNVIGVEYIYFWADTFFAWSNKEFDQFCEIYADVKLPFWCQTRVETVTEEKINKLKDVGLHFMTFGMEHGNEKFRADVIKRKYPNEAAVEALKIPAALDVPFAINNIIGFPGETHELAMDTVELNRQFASQQMSCSILQPYSGTALRKVCEDAGYLDPDALCPANSEDTIMNMPQFTSEELRGLRRTFAMYVKFPKDRWNEIALAEQLTPEGDAVWEKLSQEYQETFFASTNPDITEQGNPDPQSTQLLGSQV